MPIVTTSDKRRNEEGSVGLCTLSVISLDKERNEEGYWLSVVC